MPIPTTTIDVKRESLREVAAERIRTAIFDGTLQPGERLHDLELQEWLGISRTPLREALNDLARVGLVEVNAQRSTRVASPRHEDRTAILQTLGALVGGVVRVAVPQLSAAQRDRLTIQLETAISTVEVRDTHAHGKEGWELVDLFIDACPNSYLVRATRETVDSLAYQLAVTRTDTSTDWAALDDGYARLLQALRDEDAIQAELAIETIFRL